MQIKQMLFPMMSMALTMAPCSHLHAQVPTPVSQMEKLDRGLVALPAQDKGIFLSWRLLGTDSKNVCFDIERDGKIIAHQVKLTNSPLECLLCCFFLLRAQSDLSQALPEHDLTALVP